MIQHFSIEQVKANARLEEVVRQRGIALHANQSGERLTGHCPFHALDETPSFTMYVKNQRYHCFGCGADGDVIDFVQAYDGCSWREAIDRLTGMQHSRSHTPRLPLRAPRLVQPVPVLHHPPDNGSHRELLSHVQHLYQQQLQRHPSLGRLLREERGITEEGIRCCNLGYADGSLARILSNPEHQQDAQQIGLLSHTKRERMWQRIVIPECREGQCWWMIGRTVYHRMGERQSPKYLGLSLVKPLLGFGLALKRLGERHPVQAILIVEGALDYVIASQWKLPIVCVSLVGTHASMHQLTMLLDLQQRAGWVPLLISLDADDAGRQASQHLLTQLRRRTPFVTECTPFADTGVKDIGDLGTHPHGYKLLQASIEQTLSAETKGGS